MIELAKNHFKKVLNMVVNKDCKYYPCHYEGQTCIWCFCPFYPCEDNSLGEYITKKDGSKVWSCEKCFWIHNEDVAIEILREIIKLVKDKNSEEALKLFENRELLLKIKNKVKEEKK